MVLFYSSVGLALAAMMLYHVVLKVTPSDANPAISLIVTYATCIVLCLGLFLIFPLKSSLTAAFRQLNWTSFGLAFALVGLEVGFLLAYRAGWNVSSASIVVGAAVAVLLIPVGVLLFKEALSPVNVIGVLVCVMGFVMVNWKS